VRIDVALVVLTSRLAFEGEGATQSEAEEEARGDSRDAPMREAAATKRGAEERRLADFAASLASFNRRGIKNVSAFVLSGKIPPLHDRFLVVDGAVWFLGNSLNALGDRASLILQVPDSEPIAKRLLEMKAQALSFEDYAERRRKAASGDKGGAE
jgi:hypothetical protein